MLCRQLCITMPQWLSYGIIRNAELLTIAAIAGFPTGHYLTEKLYIKTLPVNFRLPGRFRVMILETIRWKIKAKII